MSTEAENLETATAPTEEEALQPLTEADQAMLFFDRAMKRLSELYPNVQITPRMTMDFSMKQQPKE